MSTIYNVSPQQLAEWLAADEAVLIDVREVAEYQTSSIAKARNLPLSQVTVDEAHLPEHQHKKLVIHCQSGRRSLMACEQLKQQGAPYDLWNLDGGIVAWKQAGLPVQEGNKKMLAIDQQVQIAIGLLIIIGVLLGHFVNYAWYLFPVFIALGLINAGVTGSCLLGQLISKMPWNQR